MSARLLGPFVLGVVLAAGCGGAASSDAAGAPSLVLVTLDTTDPGALSCYGGPAGLTPALDALAAGGILFETARTTAPLTLPAHASILTGLVPVRHGVRRNGGAVLSPAAETLAERARAAGCETAAFVAAVVLDREFGLDQGFETYVDPPTPDTVQAELEASLPADVVVERALDWLGRRDASRPFLLWVHLFDPHYPYRPPARFLDGAAGGDAYLGEVAAMDAAVGRLIDGLDLERTTLIVVGDHGEGRGRHGEETHGTFVYDTTLRVPLLVRPAGGVAPRRVARPVSVVDVFPTALVALGLGSAGDVDGVALLDDTQETRGAYFESYLGWISFHWSPVAGWADAETKYVHAAEPELFDLVDDPAETRNVLGQRAASAERARRAIADLCDRPRLEAQELQEGYRGLAGEIERLGYAGTGPLEARFPEPLEASERPAPHARVQAYAAYKEGQKRLATGDAEGAVSFLREVVATNPKNHKARFALGLALQRGERWEEAAQAFAGALRHATGERIPAQLNLAVCLQNLGRVDEALAHYELALGETLGPPGALELWIDLLERTGQAEEAARQRARIGSRRP